jgi:hypothetical protein
MARAGFDRLPWVSILLCAFSFLQSRGDGYLFTRRTRQRIDHRGQSRWELFQIDVKEVQTGTWRLIDAENSLYDTGIESIALLDMASVCVGRYVRIRSTGVRRRTGNE